MSKSGSALRRYSQIPPEQRGASLAAASAFLTDARLPAEARQPDVSTPLSSARRLGDISITDWNTLFRAVESRLQHCVADISTGGPGCVLRTAVLECVEELKHLHMTLGHERRCRVRVELGFAKHMQRAQRSSGGRSSRAPLGPA